MARTIKDPQERKTEIMDAAWALFQSRGFEQTSVNEIIEKAGIAKGTFYYYFTSKDEILDAVIARSVDTQAAQLEQALDHMDANAIEKIRTVLQNASNTDALEDYLHRPENFVMHQKTLILSMKKTAPIIEKIIRQGIAEGLFHTEYPGEFTEFLLAGTHLLFDPTIFPCDDTQYRARLMYLADHIEAGLRAERGSLSFLPELAQKDI
jgi:AcrR family transcriptional regulator